MFWSPAVATFSVVSARAGPKTAADSAAARTKLLRYMRSSPLPPRSYLNRAAACVTAVLRREQVQGGSRHRYSDLRSFAEFRFVVDEEALPGRVDRVAPDIARVARCRDPAGKRQRGGRERLVRGQQPGRAGAEIGVERSVAP